MVQVITTANIAPRSHFFAENKKLFFARAPLIFINMVIGIDLGTTNSCWAVVNDQGSAEVLENSEGQRTTPSVVAYQPEQRLVGQVAKHQAALSPETTISSVKRLLGRRAEEISSQQFPQQLVTGDNQQLQIAIPDQQPVTPVEVSAAILGKIKADAEARLGTEVSAAVITVPAYFNDPQRQATKQAGEIAGLDVLRIINEPTAAALAYGFGDQEQEKTILVFDLGGGTFDVSVLDIGEGLFEVLGTAGDNYLGGDDFDLALALWLAQRFKDAYQVDPGQDPNAWQRILEAAEKGKRELSSAPEIEISLPFLAADQQGQPQHLQEKITRAQFEELVDPLLQRLSTPIEQALSGRQVDEVILVGGMSRMPAVINRLQQITGITPTAGVNPDEVVACGAALQGALLAGNSTAITLIDVTPLALGVETRGQVMTEMFSANTPIPAERQEIFSTAEDNQQSVQIHVLQGLGKNIADNKSLGRFTLDHIPPAPAGVPEIAVSFNIDADGLLQVEATERQSGQRQGITIEGSSKLDAAQISRLRAIEEDYHQPAIEPEEQLELPEAIDDQPEALPPSPQADHRPVSEQLAPAPVAASRSTAPALNISGALRQLQAEIKELDRRRR